MAVIGRHLTDSERLALAEALVAGQEAKPRKTAAKVALDCGVNEDTAYKLRRELLALGLAKLRETVGKAAPPDPVERHDAAFWRGKASRLEKERNELLRLTRELGVLDGLKVGAAPDLPAPAVGQGHRSRAVLLCHTSDWHVGEVVNADETNGWNGYDLATAEKRVRQYTHAALEKGRQWTADAALDGVIVTMAGDSISGDIHEELSQTNELTSLGQVTAAARLYTGMIRALADEYGRVHVMATPGNHGRTTVKPTAKRYGALSYDTHVARLTAREFDGDGRVTFDIADGPDAEITVYGRRLIVTHGDKIGTGGGQGFVGPALPIMRGAQKLRAQYAANGPTPYLICMGHYHTSVNGPGVLANGSLIGLSEYGMAGRFSVEPPQQWLAVIRSRWGLAERAEIQLTTPTKPRVRATADGLVAAG